MKRPYIIICVGGVLAVGAIWEAGLRSPAKAEESAIYRAPYDATRASRDIEFYAARVKRDPISALDYNSLAGACLQKFRETADDSLAIRAEKVARKSVQVRQRKNESGYMRLAQALLAQHRFRNALAAAHNATAISPENRSCVRLETECLLEVGEYSQAAKLFRQNAETPEPVDDKIVHARMLAIDGHPREALAMMRDVVKVVDSNPDLLGPELAWLYDRTAEIASSLGLAAEAERLYDQSIKLFPVDYKGMSGRARLAANLGDAGKAIEWADRAIKVDPTIEMLDLKIDCLRKLGGDTSAIARQVEEVTRIERIRGAMHDRQRAMYLADNSLKLDEAMMLARKELKQRRDILAWDTLAWVCYKSGKLDEAESALKKAMSRGTLDPKMLYHAGMIASARGERAVAQKCLGQVAAIYPHSCVMPCREVVARR